MAILQDIQAARALGIISIADFHMFLKCKEAILRREEAEERERKEAGKFATYEEYARAHK